MSEIEAAFKCRVKRRFFPLWQYQISMEKMEYSHYLYLRGPANDNLWLPEDRRYLKATKCRIILHRNETEFSSSQSLQQVIRLKTIGSFAYGETHMYS
jgi:hypothetical protein